MTFFVLNTNYLMTIISLVDRRGFRLEMLYGRRIFKNRRAQEGSDKPACKNCCLFAQKATENWSENPLKKSMVRRTIRLLQL